MGRLSFSKFFIRTAFYIVLNTPPMGNGLFRFSEYKPVSFLAISHNIRWPKFEWTEVYSHSFKFSSSDHVYVFLHQEFCFFSPNTSTCQSVYSNNGQELVRVNLFIKVCLINAISGKLWVIFIRDLWVSGDGMCADRFREGGHNFHLACLCSSRSAHRVADIHTYTSMQICTCQDSCV